MQNYDLYSLFGEIKNGQERILVLLNDFLQGKSQPRIYDLPELQVILHVSKRTIATWLKQGLLPHSRVGGKIWISESQLNEFLERNSQGNDRIKELLKAGRRGV